MSAILQFILYILFCKVAEKRNKFLFRIENLRFSLTIVSNFIFLYYRKKFIFIIKNIDNIYIICLMLF